MFGLRFRKTTTEAKYIDNYMTIYLYKNEKLVKTIKTTWNIKDIKGDTAYLAWSATINNPGEYVMKLKVANDVGLIDFGHLIVVK